MRSAVLNALGPENLRRPSASHAVGPEPRRLGLNLLLNLVLPLLVYRFLAGHGVVQALAFALAGAVPALIVAWTWLRHRRLNATGLAGVVAAASGLVIALFSGNTFLVEVKESILYALFGIACLGSALAGRPLLFYIGRYIARRRGDSAARDYDSRWQERAFRRRQLVITNVWGFGLLAFAAVRTALALLLPVAAFVVAAPMLLLAVSAGLIVWSVRFGRRLSV